VNETCFLDFYRPAELKLTLVDAKRKYRPSTNMGYLLVQCILFTTGDIAGRILQVTST
jgi:hypothetical protein